MADFTKILDVRAKQAGVNLSLVPLVPIMGAIAENAEKFGKRGFGSTEISSIENVLWNDWDTALLNLRGLESQIGTIGPRQRSILASAVGSRDSEAMPLRIGENACAPGDNGYCKTGEPGPFPFAKEAARHPEQTADLTYLATKVYPERFATAFSEEAAAIVVNRALEISRGLGGAADRFSGPGSPPVFDPGASLAPVPSPERKAGVGMGLILGAAALGAILLLSRK